MSRWTHSRQSARGENVPVSAAVSSERAAMDEPSRTDPLDPQGDFFPSLVVRRWTDDGEERRHRRDGRLSATCGGKQGDNSDPTHADSL